ncbi:MAG: Propionate kinase [Legionellaceae bacterium]
MHNYILVLNCGSSSIKFAIVEPVLSKICFNGIVEQINTTDTLFIWYENGSKEQKSIPQADYETSIKLVLDILHQKGFTHGLIGIGHRVVHGGEKLIESVLITEDVLAEIAQCSRLAPLHNPAHVKGIQAAQRIFADLPHIAVFDTAFHQTMPEHAYLYPLPQQYYEQYAIRRYGFHGISYRYIVSQAITQLNLPRDNHALLIAHLGNGCSATAVLNGKSIDTSMGLTPLEGLMMGSRTGDIDPALHAYLAAESQMDLNEITALFNQQSGLLGVSGLSMDMRTLHEAAEKGHKKAQLAITMFCYRLAKYLGALSTVLPTLDALIFTGGIGENAFMVRERVIKQLSILNFFLDQEHNKTHGKNNGGIITTENSRCAMVIPTNEEVMIANDVKQIVSQL